MTDHYGGIAFTQDVGHVQDRYGSGRFYGRRKLPPDVADNPQTMTDDVREFLQARDSFYLASVSETGWPYVQFRGGPPGFVTIVNDSTIGWADFRGNLQYISTGNLAGDDRVAIIAVDYPARRRLKIYGHAKVIFAENDPDRVAALAPIDYEAVIERGVFVTVVAFDWNCPQHITPKYTLAELEPRLSTMRRRVAQLEAENAALRAGSRAAGTVI
jgi:predicted pyridoxine 5'-phosphate oxidase superfamily flavin-nucleotide-binding protein